MCCTQWRRKYKRRKGENKEEHLEKKTSLCPAGRRRRDFQNEYFACIKLGVCSV
jgi:hypothetical protein